MFVLEITDDGQGFDPETAKQRGGMGLASMRERAKEMHGTLSIESSPGEGATISVRVPVPVSGSRSDNR